MREFPKQSRVVTMCEADVKEYDEARELHLQCPVEGRRSEAEQSASQEPCLKRAGHMVRRAF